MVQDTLFESRGPSYKISKALVPGFIGASVRRSKDKLAPNHYPVQSVLKGFKIANEDRTGYYQKGMVKQTSD